MSNVAKHPNSFADQFTINPERLKKYKYDADAVMNLNTAEHYSDKIDYILEHGEQQSGAKLPFEKCTDMRFRESEVTIWTGYNGSYKSMLLGQVALGFISQEQSVVIASPEMPPVTTLMRMMSQFTGGRDLIQHAKQTFNEWAKNKLWLYDQPSGIDAETLLGVIDICRRSLKVDHFVIDSLMKCGINGDDYNKQKWFVDNLCTIAKDTGIHIHLVAHQKKPQQGKREVDRYDIAGSGDISNLVDNVIICYRNYNEEKSYTNGIHVDKQRHYTGGGDPEPKYVFWMDGGSLQFIEKEHGPVNTPSVWTQA